MASDADAEMEGSSRQRVRDADRRRWPRLRARADGRAGDHHRIRRCDWQAHLERRPCRAVQGEPGRRVARPRPKSSPVLANGRLYTFGISGILSCLDAASGKVIWRKQPSAEQPNFGVAMSPLVVDGLLVVFVGGHEHGALTAFDAVSGARALAVDGGAPAYASPVLATLAGVRQLVTQSRTHVVGVSLAGALLWQISADDALRPELRDAGGRRRSRDLRGPLEPDDGGPDREVGRDRVRHRKSGRTRTSRCT